MPRSPRSPVAALLSLLVLAGTAVQAQPLPRAATASGAKQGATRTAAIHVRSVRLVPVGQRVQVHVATSGRATLLHGWAGGSGSRMYVDVRGASVTRRTVVNAPPANTVVASVRVSQYRTDPPVSRIVLNLKPGFRPQQATPAGRAPAVLTYPGALVAKSSPRAADPTKRWGKPAPQAKRTPAAQPKTARLTPRQGRSRVIAIDAGHGGRDPGASGPRGTREKQVALDVARRVAESLRRRGHRVVLSRTTDRSLGPRSRTAWVQRNPSAVLVSIHCDSSPYRSYRGGATTYYHGRSASSRQLARSVQRGLVRRTGVRDGGLRSDYTRYGRGFYLLRRAKRPAVLVEAGYISNSQTERLLASAAYRQKLADGIADGIVQYLN